MKKIIALFIMYFLTSPLNAADLEKCAGIEYTADTMMTFHQMGSDVEKAKDTYAKLFKEKSEIFNKIVDEAKNSPVYADEKEAENAIENFKSKWKKYCLEHNID
ncbi:3-hydroxybutyryl-CoA dehydrogenase [Acinetobacter gyllenbergii]|nr:3-hydroxybutyryl-CoA dehydrogenase [Acinetobacter gyllenbergii]